MAKMSTIAAAVEQRVILFGPPKTGKTQLAGALAEHYNILYIGLEQGHTTFAKLPLEWQERIEVINIRDSRVYPIAIETCMKIVKGEPVNICVAHSKVACPICSKKGAEKETERVALKELDKSWIVIWDSLTQLTNSGIAHITKNQDDDYKLQLDDWGALKVLMDKFLSQIQVAPYHVVCISHEEEVKFEDGRTKIVPVAGSANSSRNTAKYFDHVVYCNVINKKHVVGSATDYSTTVLTGSRTDVKLEATKEGGTLLDIFTNWKLPNFGMPGSAVVQPASVTGSDDVTLTITNPTIDQLVSAGNTEREGVNTSSIETRTPGQVASDNMQAKLALLRKK